MILGSVMTLNTPLTSVTMLGFLKMAICRPSSRTTSLGETIKNAAATIALEDVSVSYKLCKRSLHTYRHIMTIKTA